MKVVVHFEAREELQSLPKAERAAMVNAFTKLEAAGLQLGYPHTSHVQGTTLRELRPRAGRSPWRALYCRVGDLLLVAAIGPEAEVDPRGFKAAIRRAEERIARF